MNVDSRLRRQGGYWVCPFGCRRSAPFICAHLDRKSYTRSATMTSSMREALGDPGVVELIDELHAAQNPPRSSQRYLDLAARRLERAQQRAAAWWEAYQELKRLENLRFHASSPRIGDRAPGRCRRLGWTEGLLGEPVLQDLDNGERRWV